MKSLKIVSILFVISCFIINIADAGPVFCAACLEAQPVLAAQIIATCSPLLWCPPLYVGCLGAIFATDGALCMGLCLVPGA